MNPLAVCALLGLGCAAPHTHARHEVLGMVAGHAREVLQADWAKHADDPYANERLYHVTKDSADVWQVGPTDTLIVLYVLDVEPIPAHRATPMSFIPAAFPDGPSLHTHQSYCDPSPWGLVGCSLERPESHQCVPSFTDRRTQLDQGHSYDFIQCGPSQFVLYRPEEK